MASTMKSLPLGNGNETGQQTADENMNEPKLTYAASWNIASSISHVIRREPAPPRFSGSVCSLITAHNASKNGRVPGMPRVHQVRRKVPRRS